MKSAEQDSYEWRMLVEAKQTTLGFAEWLEIKNQLRSKLNPGQIKMAQALARMRPTGYGKLPEDYDAELGTWSLALTALAIYFKLPEDITAAFRELAINYRG